MNQDDIVRLLVAETSLNDAEMFISVLRNAGHAVRASHVEDLEDLHSALEEHAFELFLCTLHLDELPLADAAHAVQESGRDLPLIAVTEEDGPARRREAMQAGALDLVSKEDLEHLKLVVRRELRHLQERRRLRRIEKALKESERRASALLDSSRDAIAYVHEGMHIYANPAYLEKFGVDAFEEIEGMPLLDMIAPEDQKDFKDLLRRYSRGDRTEPEADLRMVARDQTLPVQVSLSAATVDGEPCTQVLIRDQSAEHDLEAQLDSLSKTDLLTGLFHRAHFVDRLEQNIRESAGNEESSDGLLYIQVENLDGIRQTLGITACDKVITDVAALVTGELDEGAIAGRFADDVFTVLLPHRGVHDTVAVAEAIRQKVEDHIVETDRHTVTATCTVGAVMVGEKARDASEAIARAHRGCEIAREAGGNQVYLLPAEDDSEGAGGDQHWHTLIQDALERDSFHLVYMPVAALNGDTTSRYEVRVRLRNEEGDELRGADFIPRAEEAGLMAQVDRWVVDHALAALSRGLQHDPERTLMIKISGPTLSDEGFLAFLGERLKAHGIKGRNVNFEVNEPVAVTQLNEARETFRGLKELGCGFTLDHFGSGVNPFQLLKHLPADYLKLDHSLGRDLADNEETQERVQSIIDNAHSMKKRVIAGYVEDAMGMATYWRYQVDFVQGHFLQAPSLTMDYDFTGTVM